MSNASNITPEEFRSICDGIMEHIRPGIEPALAKWLRTAPTGLPVVISRVTSTAGGVAVISRDDLVGVAEPGDGHHAAHVEAIGGPRHLVPCVLTFVELGWSHTVWIEPLSESEVQ